MTIYNKLNKTNAKDFMKENFDSDPDAYNAFYDAVHTLAKLGFEDMSELFDLLYEYGGELFYD